MCILHSIFKIHTVPLQATIMKAASLTYLVLLSVRSAAQSTPVSFSPSATVVGSSSVNSGGVESFGGIPYAQPPVGQLRLKPPQKITSPQCIIDGTKFVPTCSQFNRPPPVVNDTFTQLFSGALNATFPWTLPSSEDCLTLSHQAPKT